MNAVYPSHTCVLCSSAKLSELDGFSDLPRVTSDSRPWPKGGRLFVCLECGTMQKIADPIWLDEIDTIYKSYQIYHQSGGSEQPIFQAGSATPQPRSLKFFTYLKKRLALPDHLSALDFGCGTGSALRTYAAHQPHWTLYGAELSERSLAALKEIAGFEALYTSPPQDIPRRFDLITALHSLEHVLNPVATLKALGDRLEDHGSLAVLVPDCGRTPYDLAIADHLTHFTLDTLRFAADRAGLETTEASDSVLTKELSWVGRPHDRTERPIRPPRSAPAVDWAKTAIDWLRAQLDVARAIAKRNRGFGIFGTSISSTWLQNGLEDPVAFFVDEDPGRIGRTHLGRPVLAPADIPKGADVFIPLVPEVASPLLARLGHLPVSFHVPLPYSSIRPSLEPTARAGQ